MHFQDLEALGIPDLNIAGLSVWVHGREFPDAQDYWDGNWLKVTAVCSYPQSSVRVRGPIVHLGELHSLVRGMTRLYLCLQSETALRCIEPNLAVLFQAQQNGLIQVKITLTPDHKAESHTYIDSFDQACLSAIIAACQVILAKFPLSRSQAGR